MINLDKVGLPWSFRCIDETAIASKLRIVSKSEKYKECLERIDVSLDHPDCRYMPAVSFWFKRLILRTLEACENAHIGKAWMQSALAAAEPQAAAANVLKQLRGIDEAHDGITRRLQYWDDIRECAVPPSQAKRIAST